MVKNNKLTSKERVTILMARRIKPSLSLSNALSQREKVMKKEWTTAVLPRMRKYGKDEIKRIKGIRKKLGL